MSDTTGYIIPFIFDNLPLRGRLIRLPNLEQAVPSLPKDSPAAAKALCETVLSSALMATELKNPDIDKQATVSVHMQSAGPVEVITAQCTHHGNMRAYIRLAEDAPQDLKFDALFGEVGGICAVTVDYGPKTEPYQSLIALDQGSVLKSIEAYFKQSAQVPTLIASALDRVNDHSAAILFLQEMPGKEKMSEDDWNRMGFILETIKDEEFLTGEVTPETLLMRLFAEDEVRIFSEEPLAFKTENLRERMAMAIRQLGQEQVAEMLQEDSSITMSDQFTGQEETFTKEDVEAIFAATH